MDFALTATPYEQFGANAKSLVDVDDLSVQLKSLETPEPLSMELRTAIKPIEISETDSISDELERV